MAIFKTTWVVLQVWKYSEKELYYKIFFRDYWVLTVSKRKKSKEKPIDIWYFINCEVITSEKSSVHTIGNISINSFFETQNIPYKQIESFLLLLWYIKKNIPDWSPHYELFDIISLAIDSQESLNTDKLILTHIKIIACLWNLWDTHPDTTTQKILTFIHNNKYSQIMKLWSIPEENKKHLEQML